MNISFLFLPELAEVQFTVYSFVMAIVFNSLLILMIYFLRKSKYFIKYFGVNTMVFLYVMGITRIILPLEVTKFHIMIEDSVAYPAIMDFLYQTDKNTFMDDYTIPIILLCIWLGITVILITYHLMKYQKVKKFYLGMKNLASQELIEFCSDVAKERGIKRKVKLIVSDKIPAPVSFGFFKPVVALPDRDFTPKELDFIINHECCHIRNKDIAVKLLIQLYCCIFWWNPVSYLLKKDLDLCLEIKCDSRVIENYTEAERMNYFEVLLKMLEEVSNYKKKSPLVVSEFARKQDSKRLKQRFASIAYKKSATVKTVMLNITACLMAICLFFASYIVIVQPMWDIPEGELSEEGAVYADETNAYVLKKTDGTYIFCFEGYEVPVPEEDVALGMYRQYPLIEEQEVTE